MNQDVNKVDENEEFLLIPANGGGAVVHRDQIVGARPNGTDNGAIVYTKAGPSIYTTLSTKNLASILAARTVEAKN